MLQLPNYEKLEFPKMTHPIVHAAISSSVGFQTNPKLFTERLEKLR